jgi:hypothetical protein
MIIFSPEEILKTTPSNLHKRLKTMELHFMNRGGCIPWCAVGAPVNAAGRLKFQSERYLCISEAKKIEYAYREKLWGWQGARGRVARSLKGALIW